MRPSRRHRGPTPLPCPIYVCRPRPCDPGAMCAPPTAWILGLVGLNFRQSRAVKYGRSISYTQSVRCELKPYSKAVPYTCLRLRATVPCMPWCMLVAPPPPRAATRGVRAPPFYRQLLTSDVHVVVHVAAIVAGRMGR